MFILCATSMGMCVCGHKRVSVKCSARSFAKVKCQSDDDNDVNERANKNRNHKMKTLDKMYTTRSSKSMESVDRKGKKLTESNLGRECE